MQVGRVILLRFFSNILLLCSRISEWPLLQKIRTVPLVHWEIPMVVNDNEITTVHQRCEIPEVQALCDFYVSYRLGGFL
jgi:hypothetical protein